MFQFAKIQLSMMNEERMSLLSYILKCYIYIYYILIYDNYFKWFFKIDEINENRFEIESEW